MFVNIVTMREASSCDRTRTEGEEVSRLQAIDRSRVSKYDCYGFCIDMCEGNAVDIAILWTCPPHEAKVFRLAKATVCNDYWTRYQMEGRLRGNQAPTGQTRHSTVSDFANVTGFNIPMPLRRSRTCHQQLPNQTYRRRSQHCIAR